MRPNATISAYILGVITSEKYNSVRPSVPIYAGLLAIYLEEYDGQSFPEICLIASLLRLVLLTSGIKQVAGKYKPSPSCTVGLQGENIVDLLLRRGFITNATDLAKARAAQRHITRAILQPIIQLESTYQGGHAYTASLDRAAQRAITANTATSRNSPFTVDFDV